MNVNLIIHNIFAVASSVMIIGAFFYILLNNPRSKSNITFSLLVLMGFFFVASHASGVNIKDPLLSRAVLMFNLCLFPLGVFTVHAVLTELGIDRQRKLALYAIYLSGFIFTAWFLFNPDQFLLPSAAKMYFPNYYNPGSLNWLRVAFLYGIALPYAFYEMLTAYRRLNIRADKLRLRYFIFALAVGYGVGSMPNFLVYDIAVDPLLGMPFGVLFAVPLAYGTVKYELLNVKIIAKQAFLYALAVVLIGGAMILMEYLNRLIERANPNFPVWTIFLVYGLITVTAAVLIWKKIREADLMKYEFITTVTHKFRTPLTHVKYAAENLLEQPAGKIVRTDIERIISANDKLVELTNMLVGVAESEKDQGISHFERLDILKLSQDAIESLRPQFKARRLIVNTTVKKSEGVFVQGDIFRLPFVLRSLLENALKYSQAGGQITVAVEKNKDRAVWRVRDRGLGLTKEELKRVFNKFYRGPRARLIDTEGLGINLYISKKIILSHGGQIWAASAGPGQGSVFSFSLPLAKG